MTEPNPHTAQFPSDFIWGVATSSYQIEGAHDQGGRSESIWDRFSHTPDKTFNGETGDVACDHYHRSATDVELMEDLGLDAYRFSTAWVRVLPEGSGPVNPVGLDFYDQLVDRLLTAGIKPLITLYHWDLPQCLEDEGGWLNRQTAYYFAEYAQALAERLGDRVTDWLTLNEPWVSTYLGYVWGGHAPGLVGRENVGPVSHHLNLAHGLATERIRSVVPKAKVGIALNLSPMFPRSLHPADVAAARHADMFHNAWFTDPLVGRGYPEAGVSELGWNQKEVFAGDMETVTAPMDYLGINFYNRTIISSEQVEDVDRPAPIVSSETSEFTEMGWEVFAPGLYRVLMDYHRRYRFGEIYITENGRAVDDPEPSNGVVEDPDRISYLRSHLFAIHRAIGEGVPVKGYFVWTLMDNFEWAYGFSKRFGLYQLEPGTLNRIPKASANWYRQVIATNRVS